jgi:hypothetical protein
MYLSDASTIAESIDIQTTYVDDLRLVLNWLDALLREALACAHDSREPEAGTDPFRGLHISPTEVMHLISQAPGAPLMGTRPLSPQTHRVPTPNALTPLISRFGLDDFDLAVMFIAAAPELDLRYERICAYLQDDVNKKRPTVDLALNLLCGSLEDKLRRRAHFAGDAPLLRHRLLAVQGDGTAATGPLLAQVLRLDQQVVAFLLGEISLDRRLASCCRLLSGHELETKSAPGAAEADSLAAPIRRYTESEEPLRLFLQGPAAADLDGRVRALAVHAGAHLLELDLARLPAALPDFETALSVVFREAWLKGAVLHLRQFDALQGAEHARTREALAGQLAEATGLTILSGTLACDPLEAPSCHLVPVHCEAPTAAQRSAFWSQALASQGIEPIDAETLAALGERFQLGRGQIERAAAHAVFLARSRARAGPDGGPSEDELFLAARQLTRHVPR